MAAKTFREDLYYRLNVVELRLPPLAERGDDIILLAGYFLKQHTTRLGRPELELSPEARSLLLAYPWPGNVRELNNEMERAAALAHGPTLAASDLSGKITRLSAALEPDPVRAGLKQLTDKIVLDALEKHGGNKTRAALHLGLSREGLRKRLIKIGRNHENKR